MSRSIQGIRDRHERYLKDTPENVHRSYPTTRALLAAEDRAELLKIIDQLLKVSTEKELHAILKELEGAN